MNDGERRALTAFNAGSVGALLAQKGLDVSIRIDDEGNYKSEFLLRQEPPFRNVILSVRLEDEEFDGMSDEEKVVYILKRSFHEVPNDSALTNIARAIIGALSDA